MELGITGRWALVCAASKGLGKGCAEALVMEGANVVINARSSKALEETAAHLRHLNPAASIYTVAGDIALVETRQAALEACPQIDILITNAGGPPPGDFRDWSRQDWLDAIDVNMVTPIELIKATVDAMASRGFGRVINITSAAVKAPIDILGLSNGARSGLTGFIAGLSRQPQLVGRNVTINNLLPGSFDTDRLRSTQKGIAQSSGRSYEDVRDSFRRSVPSQRFGTAEEFGAFCAFLCSAQAGYMTGQNILLDGGSYPGAY
ncbi:SDR family oxidoreductase [Marinobacter algicola]|uniref:Oxidoreductase, short-chain dehydrogenase/reductase family protein n=1 Tax=Marinobacter algicola DG893 TaxID=443152 RepID=A6F0R8_9GAMM|nr:SDR family oxidoreductase [Marinobacter algicola]EDM47657.1 oxidoreductase, short-chain dehydrogenase/reductase family protein [Marinobacter algicola DG893]